jgi:DNA modification methylase
MATCIVCGKSPAWTTDEGTAYCDEHFTTYQTVKKNTKKSGNKSKTNQSSTQSVLEATPPMIISKLPEPYYEDKEHGITLYLGDCKEILWSLPNNFAQAVITDPPYLLEGKEMDWDGGRGYIADIDDNKFASGFNFDLLEIMNAKLINTNMQFFCNKTQILDYLLWAKENKTNFQMLEWHKPDCIPIGSLYLLDTEYIVHIFKDLKIKRKPTNTYFLHNVNHNKWADLHPTSKPERIVMELIKQTTDKDEIVIEPYVGSGTTPACCKMLGRRCIGVEISKKYMDLAVERITHTEANQIQSGFFDL